MFVRCANGRVYEVLLRDDTMSDSYFESCHQEHLLDKVKDRDPIAYGREQTGTIWSKEQIALTVNRPQKIGELAIVNSERPNIEIRNSATYLEVSLHFTTCDSSRCSVKNSSCSKTDKPGSSPLRSRA